MVDDGGGAARELTPLDVLLTLMREKWWAGDREGAASFAKLAAPYVHGRRAQDAEKTRSDVKSMPDAELAARIERILGVAEAEAHPDLFPELDLPGARG